MRKQKWEITIRKVEGGYFLEMPTGLDESESYAYVDKAVSDVCSKKALVKVLWEIIEEFEPYSKHSPLNVEARVTRVVNEDGDVEEVPTWED